MFREQLRQAFGFLKRTLRMEQRLPIQELLLLVEATVNYGLTIQASEKWSALPPPYVIITISELAVRFRKTPQGINDTLLLLRAMGWAEPLGCHGHWKLKLTAIASGRKYERAA
jgi:hypothetical protein